MAFTRADALALIELLYTGISLRRAVGEDASARRRFFEMVAGDPDLARRYAMAQEARAEILADEIVSIADSEGSRGLPELLLSGSRFQPRYQSNLVHSRRCPHAQCPVVC